MTIVIQLKVKRVDRTSLFLNEVLLEISTYSPFNKNKAENDFKKLFILK